MGGDRRSLEPYRSISHSLQLNETTRLESTRDDHEIGPSDQHMSQWDIELGYGSDLLGVFLFQVFDHLLKVLLASSLLEVSQQ